MIFSCHWMCKLEVYKCSLRLEAKNKHRKHKKRMSDSLLQFFWKNDSRILSSSSLIMSFSFLVCFEWFKIRWVHWLRFYKTSLYLRGKDAMIKDFKFEILIHFNPLVTKHWTLYTKHLMSSPFIYQIDQCF